MIKREKKEGITLSLKEDILNRYKDFCNKHGYLLSRRLEILMMRDIKIKDRIERGILKEGDRNENN